MVHSAGLAIIYQNKILLVKPTNARWWKSYGIPKGHVEEDESTIDAAIREVKEEVGIDIPKFMIGEEHKPRNFKCKGILEMFKEFLQNYKDEKHAPILQNQQDKDEKISPIW